MTVKCTDCNAVERTNASRMCPRCFSDMEYVGEDKRGRAVFETEKDPLNGYYLVRKHKCTNPDCTFESVSFEFDN